MIALHSIAPYASARPSTTPGPRCELCGSPLGEPHRHVVELGQRGVQCACHACGILFRRGDANARYRTIPDRIRRADSFALTSTQWAQLGIPVSIAICFRDSQRGQGIVCYPGPAGITEGELEPEVWGALCAATELVAELEDDVEALLVRGARGVAELTCYLVPISTAYELVARLRVAWEGFSGGERAEAELAAFFAELDHKGGES